MKGESKRQMITGCVNVYKHICRKHSRHLLKISLHQQQSKVNTYEYQYGCVYFAYYLPIGWLV